MTLTDTRPAEAPASDTSQVSDAALAVPESPFTTSDHKRIGRYYLVAATLFVLISGAIGVALEIELSAKGVTVVGNNYVRLFNLHSTVAPLLFLPALFVGLGTYLVPLQIGARRVAFPRLAALAFWTYVGGGSLLLASYVIGRPKGWGIALSAPAADLKDRGHATDLWAAALMLVTLASLLAAANLFTTVLKMRAPGMTMARVPAFSWSILAVSAATLVTAPVFLAGMLLVYLDHHFGGGAVFSPTQVDGGLIWQHLVWLYGRPDVYLVAVPALGAMTDVVATHARRPLLAPAAAKALIFSAAVLSFGILAANATVEGAVLIPTPSLLSVAVIIPIGLLALLWLGSIRPNDVRFHVSLLYVLGFVLMLVAGAVNAAIAPSKHLVGGINGSAWTTGQIHAVLFAAPTFAAFAAIYHWSPKIWGKALNQLLGVVQWLLLAGGFLLTSLGAWLAGYDGASWHTDDYIGSNAVHWFNFARLSSAGGVLVALGLLVFLANAGQSWMTFRKGAAELAADPYEATTLEWATSSPPPADNFATIPEIRSDAPLADLRAAGGR